MIRTAILVTTLALGAWGCTATAGENPTAPAASPYSASPVIEGDENQRARQQLAKEILRNKDLPDVLNKAKAIIKEGRKPIRSAMAPVKKGTRYIQPPK